MDFRTFLLLLAMLAPAYVFGQGQGLQPRFALDLELNRTAQSRNIVQVPNEAPNTRFSLREPGGDAARWVGRVGLDISLAPRHELRLLYAPLELEASGESARPIVFQGRTFAPGQPIDTTYRFDSYRLGWRYTLSETVSWTWKLGATAKLRSAEISLRQGGLVETRTDTGLVPLLALYGEYRFSPGWRAILDFEGLAGGGGRAIDLGLRLSYDLTREWALGVGYRMLDGGVDSRDLYNFTRLNSFGINARYRW